MGNPGCLMARSYAILPKTNIAIENPPFWWYLEGNMGISMGYVSFREGSGVWNNPPQNWVGFHPLYQGCRFGPESSRQTLVKHQYLDPFWIASVADCFRKGLGDNFLQPWRYTLPQPGALWEKAAQLGYPELRSEYLDPTVSAVFWKPELQVVLIGAN